jgi:hypothetical protein
MNRIRSENNRRSNKPKLSWDPDDGYLEHDRASPLMLDAHQVGRVVPRAHGGFQLIIRRAVVLDHAASDYRVEPDTGLTGGLWFDPPRDAPPRGKAKGDRGRRKTRGKINGARGRREA